MVGPPSPGGDAFDEVAPLRDDKREDSYYRYSAG
jgi:hypothetical protein